MGEREFKVRITYRRVMTEIVTVTGPDGPLTQEQLDAIEEAAAEDLDPDDDVEGFEILTDYDEVPMPVEPPDDAWVPAGAHQYATTGQIIIRKDGPRPVSLPPGRAWRREATNVPLLLAVPRHENLSTNPIDARYAPLLTGQLVALDFSGVPIIAALDDDGAIVSAVAPLVDDAKPCKEFPAIVWLDGRRAEVPND